MPGKVKGRHAFIHYPGLDGMPHGRIPRPPSVGAKLLAVVAGGSDCAVTDPAPRAAAASAARVDCFMFGFLVG
jgi:hypothetical protein